MSKKTSTYYECDRCNLTTQPEDFVRLGWVTIGSNLHHLCCHCLVRFQTEWLFAPNATTTTKDPR